MPMQVERPNSLQPIPNHARKVFSGLIFDVYQWEQQLFDGTTRIFEKIRRPDTVMIVPILDDGSILLVEQEQPGKQPFIGVPGGRVEPGEEVLDAAKRELLEESGYEASELTLWDAQHPTPKIDWVVYVLIAKGLKKVAQPANDADERIVLKHVTFDEFVNLSTDRRFLERALILTLLEAKCSPEKAEQLRNLLKPVTS